MSRRRLYTGLWPLLVSAGILTWLALDLGAGPFFAALHTLTPLAIAAALCLGAAGTVIQAYRWRLVSRGFGIELGVIDAVARCWQASFLNSVLPGGLAGDAVRAVEQGGHPDGSWRGGLGAVVGERLTGTVVVLITASLALLPRAPRLAVVVAGGAAVTAAMAWPSVRRLSGPARGAVAALSVGGWLVFVGLFAVASLSGGSDLPAPAPQHLLGLAALTLAGMSVPLSWGGWGPREGAAAFAFPLFGYSAEQGVAIAVGYGLLALVSVLPGGLVVSARVLRTLSSGSRPAGGWALGGGAPSQRRASREAAGASSHHTVSSWPRTAEAGAVQGSTGPVTARCTASALSAPATTNHTARACASAEKVSDTRRGGGLGESCTATVARSPARWARWWGNREATWASGPTPKTSTSKRGTVPPARSSRA